MGATVLLAAVLWLCPVSGFSWGDEGHEIIALIADHYLTPAVRSQVASLLDGETTGLTRGTGMAAGATWADKFRDSDRNAGQVHYRETQAWHYIDIYYLAVHEPARADAGFCEDDKTAI
jgi:hypothetical protein